MTSKRTVWLAAAWLSACGSGGAGPTPGEEATFAPASLETIFYQGEDQPLIVRATVKGSLSTPPAARVENGAEVIVRADVKTLHMGNLSSELEISLHAAPQAPLGVHDGNLRLTLCHDAACQDPYTNASWSLPFHLEVQGATRLTPLTPWNGIPDWNNDQGNAAHSGYVPVTLDPATFNRRWKVTRDHWATGPAARLRIAGGRFFLWASSHWMSSAGWVSSDGWLYAFDEFDGSVRWLTMGIAAVPAVTADKVFASAFQDQSQARWLDAAAGGAIPPSTSCSFTAPTVLGDAVYCAGTGGLTRINASDGAVRWSAAGSTAPAPAADDGQVYYVQTQDYVAPGVGSLHVLDATNGQELYAVANQDGPYDSYRWVSGVPVLGTQSLLVANGRPRSNGQIFPRPKLTRFDLVNRRHAWTIDGKFLGNPAIAKGVVYVVNDKGVDALDETSGSALWSWAPAPDDPGFYDDPFGELPIFASDGHDMVVTDNLLFASTPARTVAIRLDTHEVAWSYPMGGLLSLSNQGVLYIVNPTGSSAFAAVAINVQ